MWGLLHSLALVVGYGVLAIVFFCAAILVLFIWIFPGISRIGELLGTSGMVMFGFHNTEQEDPPSRPVCQAAKSKSTNFSYWIAVRSPELEMLPNFAIRVASGLCSRGQNYWNPENIRHSADLTVFVWLDRDRGTRCVNEVRWQMMWAEMVEKGQFISSGRFGCAYDEYDAKDLAALVEALLKDFLVHLPPVKRPPVEIPGLQKYQA